MSRFSDDSDADRGESKYSKRKPFSSGGHQDGSYGGSGRRIPSEDDEAGAAAVVDNEFYNFLHVPRMASQQEITAAYKKLSRHYHPDKHLSEERKRQAELMFAKLKEAYEVLNDPHKRAIYDCLGRKGLQEQGWEIVQRTKTPLEIREEYERLEKARAERRLQQQTNPTSKMQVAINATELFQRSYYDEGLDVDDGVGTIPTIEISGISLGQSIEAPITNADKVIIAGSVDAMAGSGSVGCCWRRQTSDRSWHEITTSFGSGPGISCNLSRRLSSRTFVNMSGSFQFTPSGLRPSFNVSLGNHLGNNTVGYLTYSSNFLARQRDMELFLSQEQSQMSTMLVRNGKTFRTMVSLQLGIPLTYLMASVTKKFGGPDEKSTNSVWQSVELRAAFKVGTFGTRLEYGIARRLSAENTLEATMLIGTPLGVTLRIRFTRSTQTYVFPIHLSDEILPQPVLYGTLIPLLAWFTAKKLILDPYEANKKRLENESLRKANLAKVSKARVEARASVDLMMERFCRMREDELVKNGFVVVLAVYGKIFDVDTNELLPVVDEMASRMKCDVTYSPPPELADGSLSEMIDVTIPVQCLVDSSGLVFFEGNWTKSELAGFYDPCVLLVEEQKDLLVRYLYQGHLHQVIIADHEAVKLPKNLHRL